MVSAGALLVCMKTWLPRPRLPWLVKGVLQGSQEEWVLQRTTSTKGAGGVEAGDA